MAREPGHGNIISGWIRAEDILARIWKRVQNAEAECMVLTSNLRVNGDRLWDSLMDMARIGPGVRGGNNRQTLTDEDGEGRKLFQSWCEKPVSPWVWTPWAICFHPPRRRCGCRSRLYGQPSRHAADRRQVRRCAGRAGRAGSHAFAERHEHQDQTPHRRGQLDQ